MRGHAMDGLRAVLCALLLAGCSQNYSEKRGEEALRERGLQVPEAGMDEMAPAPSPRAEAGERHSLGGITAVVPEGWKRMAPASSMRVAEYHLEYGGKGGNAVVAVFYFGQNQGGSVEANIERWYGQFLQPDGSATTDRARRWERQVGGMKVTLVDIGGTFSGGMGPMGASVEAKPGHRMLGAILESAIGPFFFKLTGPEETVERWEGSFEQFIGSIEAE